jgi:hypothetical protein
MSAAITSTRIKFEEIDEQLSTALAVAHPADPKSQSSIVATARDEIFRLGSIVGRLCSAFLTVAHDGCSEQKVGDEIALLLGEVFIQLFNVSRACSIDLRLSVLKKMELNGRKYPVELCKVSLH